MINDYDISQEALVKLLGGKDKLQLKTFGSKIDFEGELDSYNFKNKINNFLADIVPEKIQVITSGEKSNKITILIWYLEKN